MFKDVVSFYQFLSLALLLFTVSELVYWSLTDASECFFIHDYTLYFKLLVQWNYDLFC